MTVADRTGVGRTRSALAGNIVNGPGGYTGVVGDEQWAAEIRRLATLRGATILAHNYQLPAIQDVADHVGDSLALSRIAAEAPEDTIGSWSNAIGGRSLTGCHRVSDGSSGVAGKGTRPR